MDEIELIDAPRSYQQLNQHHDDEALSIEPDFSFGHDSINDFNGRRRYPQQQQQQQKSEHVSVRRHAFLLRQQHPRLVRLEEDSDEEDGHHGNGEEEEGYITVDGAVGDGNGDDGYNYGGDDDHVGDDGGDDRDYGDDDVGNIRVRSHCFRRAGGDDDHDYLPLGTGLNLFSSTTNINNSEIIVPVQFSSATAAAHALLQSAQRSSSALF